MPAERRHEIDEPVDFKIAETLLKQQTGEQKSRALPERIGALVLDFDGVITDNKVLVFQDGSEMVRADRSDGWGLGQLKKTGLPILVLSTEANPVVSARAGKLGLPCLQGLVYKWAALKGWLEDRGIDPAWVVYVGNDDNDLACMANVGCVVAPSDAYPAVLEIADLVLEHRGGDGAVRELCDLILQHPSKLASSGAKTQSG
jgi:YrbI family 3-deoxy-D-manno-octulosonate 8-phosphate phosphatase